MQMDACSLSQSKQNPLQNKKTARAAECWRNGRFGGLFSNTLFNNSLFNFILTLYIRNCFYRLNCLIINKLYRIICFCSKTLKSLDNQCIKEFLNCFLFVFELFLPSKTLKSLDNQRIKAILRKTNILNCFYLFYLFYLLNHLIIRVLQRFSKITLQKC